MLHNQVPELISILQTYAGTIWPFFAESQTGYPTDEVILFVADYPNTNYLERLVDYSDTLRAIISVTDQGVISKRSIQFAESKKEYRIRVSIEVITADPSLRDEMGGKLFQFLNVNNNFFHGTQSNWFIEDVDSGGITPATASLFGRTYYLWLVEHS